MIFEIKNLNVSLFKLQLKIPSFKTDDNPLLKIQGNNGSGKSTLIKLLCGLLEPNRDFFCSVNTEPLSELVKRKQVGLCLQENLFFDELTVEQHFHLLGIAGTHRLNHFIEFFNVQGLLKKKISSLSGGECQKIKLIQTLGSPRELLILDEPFTFLDSFTSSCLIDLLNSFVREDKKSIILVEHRDLKDFKFLAGCSILDLTQYVSH